MLQELTDVPCRILQNIDYYLIGTVGKLGWGNFLVLLTNTHVRMTEVSPTLVWVVKAVPTDREASKESSSHL